jgi:hypothetical protein
MQPPFELRDLVGIVNAETPDQTPLERLNCSVSLSEQLAVLGDQLVGHFVDLARRDGASWADIGTALGVSKQAVQKRFVSRRVPGDSKALFTRFDDEARAIVVRSMELAREGGQAEVNTGHILLALISDDEGRAACALKASGVTTDRLRAAILDELGPGQEDLPEHLPWAPESKKTLELSLREAFRTQAGMIGSDHILLAVLRDKTSLGGKILTRFGADRRRIAGLAGE